MRELETNDCRIPPGVVFAFLLYCVCVHASIPPPLLRREKKCCFFFPFSVGEKRNVIRRESEGCCCTWKIAGWVKGKRDRCISGGSCLGFTGEKGGKLTIE